MLALEDAIGRILAAIPPGGPELIPLSAAHGRVLLETVVAPIDLPPFDNSAMDGYAVRARDTAGASRDNPVRLKLAGKIAAGETAAAIVEPGCALRIFTGSPMPARADGVVMQEDTMTDVEDPDYVSVLEPTRAWENVRLRGEDVRAGSKVIDHGQSLSAGVLRCWQPSESLRYGSDVSPRLGFSPLAPSCGNPVRSSRAGRSMKVTESVFPRWSIRLRS